MIKEELIEKGTDSYCSILHMIEQYKQGNCPLSAITDSVMSAMDEHGKQQSIALGKWIQKCHYAPAVEDNKWQNQQPGNNEIITTEELYELFLQQLSTGEGLG